MSKPLFWDDTRLMALRRMSAKGLSSHEIAAAMAVSVDSVRGACQRYRVVLNPRRADGWDGTGISAAELARVRWAMPDDTRSLTGRICGDPLPGRSALGRQA